MASIVIPTDGTTLTLTGYAFKNMIDGDQVLLSFPNDKNTMTIGQNGNSLHKERLNGDVCEMTINVLKFLSDDIFLTPYAEHGASNGLLAGTLQRVFTKDGVEGVESYQFEGGSVKKKPDSGVNTQDGDESLSFVIQFAFAKRII